MVFTTNLAERRGNRLLTDRLDALRMAFTDVKRKHLSKIEAMVILPEHLHLPGPYQRRLEFFHSLGAHQAHFTGRLQKR